MKDRVPDRSFPCIQAAEVNYVVAVLVNRTSAHGNERKGYITLHGEVPGGPEAPEVIHSKKVCRWNVRLSKKVCRWNVRLANECERTFAEAKIEPQ